MCVNTSHVSGDYLHSEHRQISDEDISSLKLAEETLLAYLKKEVVFGTAKLLFLSRDFSRDADSRSVAALSCFLHAT